MKTKTFLWQKVYGACIAAIVALSLASCSGGEEEIIPENKPDDSEVKGDVTFTLETTGATGSGTAASPIVVETGDRLNMTINQENRYTDPDGTLHTCKPVATIKLHAETDTVVAHDLQALLAVAGAPDTKSASEGSNPQRNQTTQTFAIGGQQVVFDLSHEVYSIAGAAAKAVELPYLKPGEARFGSSDAAETRAAASLSAISVRPLGLTRAETITDSTMYEVDIRFSLDLESVHTAAASKTPLNFSVKYVGIVETVTELQDPVAGLSCSWSKGGAAVSLPLTWDATQQKTMTLTLDQTATYTNMFGNTITCNPKAQVVLTAAKDTVWADKTETLEQKGILSEPTLTATGENPTENTRGYTYVVNGQTLTFDLGWQSGLIVADADINEPITMPNARFGELTLKDVKVEERPDEAMKARGISLYTVTTTFGLEVVSEGLAEEKREAVEIVATYVAAIEPKLVRVTYKRDWEWVEPHDNMALFYYAKVHRTRHYSNGESYTDTFMDGGHMAAKGVTFFSQSFNPLITSDWEGNNEFLLYDGEVHGSTSNSDSVWVFGRTKRLYGPENMTFSWNADVYYNEFNGDPTGTWEIYESFGRYYDDQNLTLDDDVIVEGDIEPVVPENLRNRRSGWYVDNPEWVHYVRVFLYTISITNTYISDRRYDQYLLIDGQMITFTDKELRPDPEFKYWWEDLPEGGWVFHHELFMKYLGRNFYAAAHDTVLYNPSTPPEASIRKKTE